MARKPQVQPCIFCGETPCACNDTPAPKTRAKPKKAWEPPSSEPVKRFKNIEETEAKKTEDDLIFEEAVRNLGPLLSSQEQRRLHSILQPAIPTAIERRLVDWRARNGKK